MPELTAVTSKKAPRGLGNGWHLTHCTGLALIAGGARAAETADVVLTCPVVEAGLGDARKATYGRRTSETALWT